jgi:hypothetical protein
MASMTDLDESNESRFRKGDFVSLRQEFERIESPTGFRRLANG